MARVSKKFFFRSIATDIQENGFSRGKDLRAATEDDFAIVG
jgi:hypothetical protein